MKDLKVTFIQTKLHWKNIDANLKMFDDYISKIKKGSTDLIILPEMFSTGFIMQPEGLAETMKGKTTEWLRVQAKKKSAVICGSVVIKSGTKYYNRLIWMQPDGTKKTYDKRHLFRLAGEEKVYTSGKKKLIVELKGWKICPMICYDLRFPVWSRNKKNEYDLLLYVANWPEKRVHAWKQLLMARAIENQSYVAAVNRIGKDGNGINHTGQSAIIDSMGEQLSKTRPRKTATETVSLSHKHLQLMRRAFPFHKDADKFSLKD
ncbi:MAG: amidohydrolase [Bacteroidia bacterium]|nr:amidohydrolase [Bacteroidia bacterium]NNC86662.1 amidohydrolase [Bacteroidia bacterium]NNM15232.1 amidohydrolase [Bacteroidia bacterium]